MDSGTFDQLTRSPAHRLSRRSAIRRLAAGTAAASASLTLSGVVRADGKDKEKDRCRAEGEGCEDGQTCCFGLTCAIGRTSSDLRCLTIAHAAANASGNSGDSSTAIVNTSNSACAGNCVVDQDTSTTVNPG